MKCTVIIKLFIITTFCLGIDLSDAPNITMSEDRIKIISKSSNHHNLNRIEPRLISTIPDLRSTAGSPGKNIVIAEDGQSIAVIYGKFSGNPSNIFQIFVSYSTDRGISWTHFGPLSTFDCRRAYSGLDAEQDFHSTGQIYFTWCQSMLDTSCIYFAKELSFPDGLITPAYPLRNSQSGLPCIGIKDSSGLITGGSRIWDFINGDTGRVFFSNAEPHFRYGNNGYIFFLWYWENNGWPYYSESFDTGKTWTDPQLIWQNTPPYPNMEEVYCGFYRFDCEVVRDTPVVTVGLNQYIYDYGEIWVYRPDSGIPGDWHFKGKKLLGGDSIIPQTWARYTTIAADDDGNIFIGYQGIFETPNDTGADIGLFARPSYQDTWYDWRQITFNAGNIEEKHLEFAHNAPLIAGGDSIVVGMIYNNASIYPTTGNLYFDYFVLPNPPIPGIAEEHQILSNRFKVNAFPNPFNNSVIFKIPFNTCQVRLCIFNITGNLIHEFKSINHLIYWDGRCIDGSLVNSGVYLYQLSIDDLKYCGKIILTR